MTPWLSYRSKAVAYAVCVAAVAIGGAAIVHGDPAHPARASAAAAAAMTPAAFSAPTAAAAVATMVLEPITIFGQPPKSKTSLTSPTQAIPPPSPTETTAAEVTRASPTVPSSEPQADTPRGTSHHPVPNSLRPNVASKGHHLRDAQHDPVDLSLVYIQNTAWGWMGAYPLATGIFGVSPLYAVLGIATHRSPR
jgi:hypothetical protein